MKEPKREKVKKTCRLFKLKFLSLTRAIKTQAGHEREEFFQSRGKAYSIQVYWRPKMRLRNFVGQEKKLEKLKTYPSLSSTF